MTKKIIILFLVIALCFSLLPTVAKAESADFNQTVFNLNTDTDFNIDIVGSDLDNVLSVEIGLVYDPTIISIESISEGIFTNPMTGILDFGEPGNAYLLIDCDAQSSGSGVLASVLFHTNIDGGSTNITISGMTYYRNIEGQEFDPVSGTTGPNATVTVTAPDTDLPALSILTLTIESSYNYINASNTLSISGTSTDNVLVSSVTFSVDTGDSGTAVGTSTWSADVDLAEGENIIIFTSTDSSSNATSTSLTVNYSSVIPDTTPAQLSAGSPSGTLSNSITDTTLSLNTDENAICHYSTIAGTSYASSSAFTNTNSTTHTSAITGLSAGNTYNYYIRCADTANNVNPDDYLISFSISQASSGGGGLLYITPVIKQAPISIIDLDPSTDDDIKEEESGNAENMPKIFTLLGAKSELVETVSANEANLVFRTAARVEMSTENGKILERISKGRKISNNNSKFRLAFFINNGTDTTKSLGAGERAGVLDSFFSAYGKLPETESEWMDIVKIANGRWPGQRNTALENKNKSEIFKIIYKREASLANANDNAAITIISYGLRPLHRNLNSERVAVKHFLAIFKHAPTTAIDWDIVRAIAYSGAVR